MADRSADMRHILSQIQNIQFGRRLFEAEETYLYHGTSSKLIPSIQRFGLTTRSTTPKSGASREGVYLTNDVYAASEYAFLSCDLSGPGEGGVEVTLRVAIRSLVERLLGPDDYDLHDVLNGGENGGEEVPHDALAYEGDWQKVDWQTSLRMTRQVLYLGRILPSAIEWLNHDVNRWEPLRTYK